MALSTEQLVETVMREVMAELAKRGMTFAGAGVQSEKGGSVEIDMSGYRTPVLTESQLTRLGPGAGTIVVPCNTVVTPGAWDVIRSKRLTLVRKAQSHR